VGDLAGDLAGLITDLKAASGGITETPLGPRGEWTKKGDGDLVDIADGQTVLQWATKMAVLHLHSKAGQESLGVMAAFVARQTGVSEDFCRRTLKHKLIGALVLGVKQHDYGPSNINDCGMEGVVVRLMDKTARLRRAYLEKVPMKNESERDALVDAENYGTIGRMYEDGDWPESPKARAALAQEEEAV